MDLTKEEKEFLNSIRYKIKEFKIKTTLDECLANMSGETDYTVFNDGMVELVDKGIELFIIRSSFSYFLHLYCKVDIPGLGTIPMEPYYFQKELADEIEDYRKIVLDKTRQCGMSTVFALYAFWKAHFFPAESIDVISIKQSKALTFVKKIYTTMETLPEWMKTPIKAQNMQKIVFQHPGGSVSEIVSESQSDNAGRGDSLSVLIMDEAAFYQSERMARGIVASAQPTLSKTGGKMIIISTPSGVAGRGAYYYEQVVQAREGKKGTKFLSIDWWEIPDDDRIDGPKKGYNDVLKQAIKEGYYNIPAVKKKYQKLFKPVQETLYKDNEWLYAAYDDIGPTKYKQEVLHEFIISGDKIFSEDVLETVESCVVDPKFTDKLGTEEIRGLWVWKEPIDKHRYLISCDVATGTSNDFSAIQIIDVGEYEQVAEYKGHISTPSFVRLIRKIALLYNEGYVIVEANSIGESVFNGLYYDEYNPYTNLYKQKKTKNGVVRFTGWITDVKTRKLIVNDFMDWVTVDELWKTLKIYSRRLWLDMTTWVWKNGRADHADGAHDDTIIAMAIGLYNRNKAISSSESFLLTDDVGLIDSTTMGKEGTVTKETVENSFDIAMSDEYDNDQYEEEFGVDIDTARWLLG